MTPEIIEAVIVFGTLLLVVLIVVLATHRPTRVWCAALFGSDIAKAEIERTKAVNAIAARFMRERGWRLNHAVREAEDELERTLFKKDL